MSKTYSVTQLKNTNSDNVRETLDSIGEVHYNYESHYILYQGYILRPTSEYTVVENILFFVDEEGYYNIGIEK